MATGPVIKPKGSDELVLSQANRVFFGFEGLDYLRWVETKELNGDIEQQLWALKKWHKERMGFQTHLATCFLCKSFTGAVGKCRVHSNAIPIRDLQVTAIEDVFRSDILSRGFRRPRCLPHGDDLVEHMSDLRTQLESTQVRPGYSLVLLVQHELNKGKIFVAFMLAVVMTSGICIVVSVATHSAELGASIGAAVFALIAIVQVMIIWMYR